MGIRKALLQFTPLPIVKAYHMIKWFFISRNHKFGRTGNNFVETRIIQLNKTFLNKNQIDKIKVVQYLDWENPFNCSDSGKYQYQEEMENTINISEISLVFNNYGTWTVEIYYLKKGKTVSKEVKYINVEAPEYNIAYLSATLPTEIFLINLWNITTSKCPTIVGLERELLDYNALPENVFPFPLASDKELNTAYKGFYGYSQRLVAYIKMLYHMNPKTRFNLYLCDHQANYSLALMYANGIPEKNFSVFLLSDGTGSYEGFNYVFGNHDGVKIYTAMKNTWSLSRQMAKECGSQQWGKESFIFCGNPSVSWTRKSDNQMIELSNRLAYAYVIARETSNFTWILHNPDLLDIGNRILFPLPDSIKKIDFIAGIRRLEQHKKDLIKMLGLNYSVFERSHLTGKQVCVLLGSYPLPKADIKYVDATLGFFGKVFDYYYKEHPRTKVNSLRKKEMEERGIIFLNSKIPTEFYMMIDSDICLAGYLSSAFLSIGLLRNPREQILSIWDVENRKIKTDCLDFTAKTAMYIRNNSVVINDR